jgi:SOS response regulatory protein OraA/RecX
MNERAVTPEAMNVMLNQIDETEEKASQAEIDEATMAQRKADYDKMVQRLVGNGFTTRNAKRFIASQSRKMYNKFISQAKANAAKPKPLIELTPEELAGPTEE